jgi:hypothetical protein
MRINWKQHLYEIEDPNVCPHCHVRVNPHFQKHFICVDDDDEYELISIWICSNAECNRVFIGQHSLTNNTFKLIRFLNGLPKGPEWPKPVADLNIKIEGAEGKQEEVQSKFIKTYLQSLEAESHGLDEIAGMGYRKSIEYLVKDWAIKNKPKEKDKIQNLWLGDVIINYYSGDLKDILERATWLGNDQAHYLKLFDEYNISHLKELIDLIMVELDREYKKKHYIDNIQKKK